MRLFKIIIASILLTFGQACFAWNFIGHAVIAQIAYEHLTPKAKAHVDQLVNVFSREYPSITSFQRMAAWADAIRQDGMTEFSLWHFINKPFSPDGSRLPYYPQQNVAWAISQSERSLATAKNPFNQALSLAFLSHFVGDIEQPLHCATRVTQQFPQGDQGGNLYLIKSDITTNLHGLWDQGLGLYVYHSNQSVSKQINRLVINIQQQYPMSRFNKALADPNPYHWANHSFDTAKYFVYNTPQNQQPSTAYITKGQKIVMRQSALAGYRLAEILNRAFN